MGTPLSFNVTVAGERQLNVRLSQVPIRDWSFIWPKTIDLLHQIEANQFARFGARGPHGEWAPLSADYQKRKLRAKGMIAGGTRILQASGRLWRSLVAGSGDTVDERYPNRLRWGTSLKCALYHQTGYRTRLGTGKRMPKPGGLARVPARRVIDLRPDDYRLFGQVWAKEIANYIRRLGFAVAKEQGIEATPETAKLIGLGALQDNLNAGGASSPLAL
jgi:phage gpG-like protein